MRRVTAVSGGGYRGMSQALDSTYTCTHVPILKTSPDSIDAHCDSDNDCDDDPLPNQLVQATPTKETYSPRAETNTQQQESPPPTPPRVQNLNLTTEEGLDTFMDLFAWSENKMSLDICSIPQKGAVSDSFCNVRLTIQTGLACCQVNITFDDDCKYTDVAHPYIKRLHTRLAPAGNAVPAAPQPQVTPPRLVVCVGHLRVETCEKSNRTDYAVLVSPFPTPPMYSTTEHCSSSPNSSPSPPSPTSSGHRVRNGGFWLMFSGLYGDDSDDEDGYHVYHDQDGNEEQAYKNRVQQAFHDAFGGLDAFHDVDPFDIVHIGGDSSDWRDIFKPGGLATVNEIMDGFKKPAGFLFHPRLTAVQADKVEHMWMGHD